MTRTLSDIIRQYQGSQSTQGTVGWQDALETLMDYCEGGDETGVQAWARRRAEQDAKDQMAPSAGLAELAALERDIRSRVMTRRWRRRRLMQDLAGLDDRVDGLRRCYLTAVADLDRRRMAALQQRNVELQVLSEMTLQIGYTLNYADLAQRILEHVSLAVPHDIAASLIVTRETPELYIRLMRPLSAAVQEEVGQRLVQSYLRLSSNPEMIQKDVLEPHVLRAEECDDQLHVIDALGSIFQVPLFLGQRRELVGLLFVGSEAPNAFSENHLRLLYTVANQTSWSIQQLRVVLAEAEHQRLESLVEHIPDGVLIIDAAHQLVHTNPTAKRYLAQLTTATLGLTLESLGPYSIDELLQRVEALNNQEIEIEGPPYAIFELNLQALEVGPEAGGWLLMLRDVTAERQMRHHFQQQEQLATVGQLVAGIAHDFNNILSGIIGFAQSLQLRPPSVDVTRQRLDRIVEQGKRGAQLVQQMLDFSRTSIHNLQPLNLLTLVEEVYELLVPSMSETIHCEVIPEDVDFMVSADTARLQQMLLNLATNAKDAMADGGRLTFRLSRLVCLPRERPPCLGMLPGEWVVLVVSDTGTGIAPEVQPHVFEPFFTTKAPGQGTGLGLPQVYGIVKQHKGYIDIDSKVERGTQVSIYLPAIDAIEPPIPIEMPNELPLGQGAMILLVEDEFGVREATKSLLEYLGYQVLCAENGQQALEMYAAHCQVIAVVLTDMVMPEMDGVRLFHLLREINSDVKMIIMTGYPLGEAEKNFLTQGPLDWLQKPLDLTQLAQTLGRHRSSSV